MSVYLDNSATTVVCRAAAEKALQVMTVCFGNPSSLHTVGIEAERELTAARQSVARLCGAAPDNILFTSGGTEANNLAILGAAAAKRRQGRHVVTTAMEHPSVAAAFDQLEQEGYTVTRLSPGAFGSDGSGIIEPEQLEKALRPDTVLVSIMLVNNETGAWMPCQQLVPIVRKHAPNALFHTDAVQAAGKMPLQAEKWDVDLLSVSGHKFHAPKGVGALYIKKGVRILPRVYGGGQENNLRSGTEPMPAIAAFGAAVEDLPPYDQQWAHYEQLQNRLLEGLKSSPALAEVVLNRPERAVPYIVNLSVPGIRSEVMLHFLADKGVFVSSGSACSKGKGSPTLTAWGLPADRIDSALRISFCRFNQPEDVDRLLEALEQGCRQLIRRPSYRNRENPLKRAAH